MKKTIENYSFYIQVLIALTVILTFSSIVYFVDKSEKNSKNISNSQTNSLNTTNKPASLEAVFEEIVKRNDTSTDTNK